MFLFFGDLGSQSGKHQHGSFFFCWVPVIDSDSIQIDALMNCILHS